MLINGSAARLGLRDASVNMAVTSPPYYGLRLYDGLEPQVWGGEVEIRCQHVWDYQTAKRGNGGEREYGSYDGEVGRGPGIAETESATCRLCNGWLGHLGNEPRVEMYVAHLVEVGREVHRVLHPSGLWFLNLGDSYANDTKWGGQSGSKNYTSAAGEYQGQRTRRETGLPPKSKMLIPARVAIALQDDGWILRQELVWMKTNCMPESVTDRPGVAHEYVFMLAKSSRSYWDMEGVRRQQSQTTIDRFSGGGIRKQGPKAKAAKVGEVRNAALVTPQAILPNGRNYRTSDAWLTGLDSAIADLTTYADYLETMRDAGGLITGPDGEPVALWTSLKGYAGAHYAVFPEALVIDLVRGATSEMGVCPACGAPWKRVTEKDTRGPAPDDFGNMGANGSKWATQEQQSSGFRIQKNLNALRAQGRDHDNPFPKKITLGWRPTCTCAPDLAPVPAVVCDPFTGSGTVGEVCRKLGRRFIGIDLSAQYLAKNAAARAEGMTTEAGLKEAIQPRPKTSKKTAQAKKAGQMSF